MPKPTKIIMNTQKREKSRISICCKELALSAVSGKIPERHKIQPGGGKMRRGRAASQKTAL